MHARRRATSHTAQSIRRCQCQFDYRNDLKHFPQLETTCYNLGVDNAFAPCHPTPFRNPHPHGATPPCQTGQSVSPETKARSGAGHQAITIQTEPGNATSAGGSSRHENRVPPNRARAEPRARTEDAQMSTPILCAYCGAHFTPNGRGPNAARQRFCTPQHRNAWHAQQRQEALRLYRALSGDNGGRSTQPQEEQVDGTVQQTSLPSARTLRS